ncbi:MAG: PHP domain-containing protein [Oscillospiraceae bacterium]|nr:PHP domain-containing protein [Oscillospiraceae bacterium]MDD6147142.1 PHP domain-containing protein [Oscillospiraceae bacterium]
MKADLHCHTKLSDGTLGIDDMIILAKNSGVTTLAITDHDCQAGNVRASLIGARHGITVIPAVEFSATDSKRHAKAHILCYLADTPERLEGLCKSNSEKRKRAGRIMIAKVTSKFPVTAELILKCAQGSTNIYKQHIMQALMECGYTTSIFGDLFRMLFTSESRINILMESTYPEPAEIIEAIHEAGGIAVLAHPGFYDNFELLEELIPLGLDGVEVWHPKNTPEQQELLIKTAKKHDLLMTGGSDFHGGYNAEPVKLGEYGPDEDHVAQLLAYKAKRRRRQKREAAAAAAE